jgi:lipooligosaccharide transport system permease protein
MAAIANALHVVEGDYIGYRRTWRGRIISTFLNPVLFLAGMGFALGSMVDQRAGEAQLPIPFITFVATGLLAATAMQTGFGEGAWPIMAGIKWRKVFDAIIVTPVTVADLINGMLIWGTIHLAFTLSVFAIIAVPSSGPSTWARPSSPWYRRCLGGLAFQATATAITCRLKTKPA